MWSLEAHLRCKDCGTREEEWDRKKGGDRRAYIPQIFNCPGCAAAGDAMDAASKSVKALQGAGAAAGLKVRLVPKYVIDYQVKVRSPEERERMMRSEQERMQLEREANADGGAKPLRGAAGLGGSRRAPVDPKSRTLGDLPEDPPKSQ